jgi:hypothetical protein
MQGTEMTTDEEVRQLAYRLWQDEGCPDGHELQHWLRAETIWLEEHRPQSKPKQPRAPQRRKTKQSHTAEREL